MNVRSLTTGAALPTEDAPRLELATRLGSFAKVGRQALEAEGFTVQTTRLAAQPLEEWLLPDEAAPGKVADFGGACAEAGIDYFSVGTLQATTPQDGLEPFFELVPELLLAAGNAFASIQVGARTGSGGAVNLEAVRASARIMQSLAERTPEGFGNLRFAAACNCPPHVPFFPAAYYKEDDRNGGRPEFGLALEAADLAVRAFEGAGSLEEARLRLLGLLEEEAGKAADVCVGLAAEHGYTFTGLDISMAPFPEQSRSIGYALELLSGAPLGSPGTLTAAAFLTSVLKQAREQLPTVGYSGLMLPALEDQTLADRAAEGLVTIDTLLLMSAVCGLGLDTVPLPGDVSLPQLERIITDMAALAVKLDKPLTARLFPVPGKSAGEPAEWPDFPFFARGKVMHVPPVQAGAGLFAGALLDLA
ncbi:MAG: DUF711 family protein [Chloroflexota bacterium]|nr:DUF711 family protein [Chloroflexota bacterium]